MKRRWQFVLLAALASLVAGAYLPSLSFANHTDRHMWFGPPTRQDGNNSLLTQGWHGPDGQQDQDEWSLDWDGLSDSTAYSRAWATSGDSSPTVRAYGTPTVGVPWQNCDFVVWLDVWDYDTDVWMKTIGYVHTIDPQFTTIYYDFSSSEEYNGAEAVSIMTTDEDPGTCTNLGLHVHETHYPWSDGDPETALNSNYPTGLLGDCPDTPQDCEPYSNTNGDNWTRQFAWDN